MTEYRDRTTGEIKSQGQLRKENKNMSMPKVWNSFTFDALNVDPVLRTTKPTQGVGQYQYAKRNGVEQDANGNWVQAWQIVDMFADDPELGTKAEQEAAYQQRLDDDRATGNRNKRDSLIAETDWWASSDLTMTAEQTAYRQALRDITTHANWPHLEDADWPTKP
ncbi:putative tail structure protein [Roseobacter phage CRP-603]|nr:putative tail structure protein [Roseobacter phage CRP-603]